MTWKDYLDQLVKTPALWSAGIVLYHALFVALIPVALQPQWQGVLLAVDGIVIVVAAIITQKVVVAAKAVWSKLHGK